MRDAQERDTRFENPVTAQIALIKAKAQAYETLSRQSAQTGSKFLESILDLFRVPKKQQSADVNGNQNHLKL